MYLHIFGSGYYCTFSAQEKTGRANRTNDLGSTGQQARPASVASRFVLGRDSGEICTVLLGDRKSEAVLHHLRDSVTLLYYNLGTLDSF
jgi:hypothetical protein